MTFLEGVPTNRWTSSVYWSTLNSNFTLDYYFTGYRATLSSLSPRHNNSINSFRKLYHTWLYRLHQGLSSHYLGLWLFIFIVYLISVSVSECMRQGISRID